MILWNIYVSKQVCKNNPLFLGDWDTSNNPSVAAFTLLNEACAKRRGVLNDIMPFCIHILTSDSLPVEKDAVLHMYGAVAKILLKNDSYKVCLLE